MKVKKISFRKKLLFVPVVFTLLLGCAGKDVKTIEGDPETLYKEGLTRFNKRDYSEAAKKFEQLKSNFPDSPPYTLSAELKVADCHFYKKEYVEAIAAYEEFKKIHPTHEEMPYVQYQIGMAHFNEMLTLDRDQTFTKKALSNFEYLVANYPPSLFTEKAKEKIEICKRRLADNEFYVANYYYKHGNFKAASLRFQNLLEKFPKAEQEDKTLFLLGKCYVELEQWEQARQAFAKVTTEYPNSSHYGEAKKILEQSPNAKKVKEPKIKNGPAEVDVAPLVKFEEERRQCIPFDSPLSVTSNPVKANPHPKTEMETIKSDPPPKDEIEIDIKPQEEKRMVVIPGIPNPTEGKEKRMKWVFQEPGEATPAGASQPIDITSDRVETYSKENLIIFKGNVIARQKDVVIYADSIEAVTDRDKKRIEQVVASGNVKIQQGLRVGSCKKAVFNNLDQKIVLTGDPNISEGDNTVSGEEIIFDLVQNRVEVKGGAGSRGKATIQPGGDIEKAK